MQVLEADEMITEIEYLAIRCNKSECKCSRAKFINIILSGFIQFMYSSFNSRHSNNSLTDKSPLLGSVHG